MQKKSNLMFREVILLVMVSFLAGAIGGFFLDSLRKKMINSTRMSKAQKEEADFRDDLAMELGELR